MKIECYDCGHFSFQDREGRDLHVAHVGLGKCAYDSQVGLYKSAGYPRECGKFVKCDNGPEFRAWVAKQGKVRAV